MLHKLILLFGIISFVTSLQAQQTITISEENADCENAISINIDKQLMADNPKSFGNINEIHSAKGDLYYFEKEHFTVWYKFIPPNDGILSFDIIPDISTDDYDFILFECNGENCCDSIHKKQIVPIRTNISRVKYEIGGKTGLNKSGKNNFVHEGKGDAYSLPVEIHENKVYFLVLDNVYGGNGGHKIDFNFIPNKKKDKLLRGPKHMLNVTILDKVSKKIINAEITLIHFDKEYKADTILRQENSSLYLPVVMGDYYEIIAKKENYLIGKTSFSVNETDSLIKKSIELQNVEVGSSFALENVYFQGGTAVFVGSSMQSLRKLYLLMKKNKSLKIEIQGHVNLPNHAVHVKSEGYYNQLSVDRAKAVYDYLVKRGIDKDRLDYQGFGYSQMLYPDARTYEEMAKNRRVEIKIIGN
jgi:outer membrane protein OmpA-like peptidoglycan-associated protein